MQHRNIFDELYQNTDAEPFQGLDGLSELIYQTEKTELPSGPDGEDNLIPFPPRQPPAKKKVTYYLSEKVVVELCEAKAKIRVMVPPNFKRKVSMSRIVDYAVHAILDEFKTIGTDSDLVQSLMAEHPVE